MQIELEEREAEWIAGFLHQRFMGMSKEQWNRALKIGNKIAEQLNEQRPARKENVEADMWIEEEVR